MSTNAESASGSSTKQNSTNKSVTFHEGASAVAGSSDEVNTSLAPQLSLCALTSGATDESDSGENAREIPPVKDEPDVPIKVEEQEVEKEENDDESTSSTTTAELPASILAGYTTPIRPPRPANLNASFSSGRGKALARPQDFDRYSQCSKLAVEKRRIVKASYVIANWGICTDAHNIIDKPSLRLLATTSWNTNDMTLSLYLNCHQVGTDKGGSVVRFDFFPGADDNDIVQFASSLHCRLVAEYLYKANHLPQSRDEIVVYYACPSDQGYFYFIN